MNYLKRFAAMVIALMIMATTVLGTLPAKAETETPGLNVVIVYDCSLSMHHTKDSYDQALMCLDAAVMMVNMCDARYSQVAVVPFVYQPIGKHNVRADVNRPGQTKEFNYQFYGEWTDISDANKRVALCNEMMKYFRYDEIVNGYTNQAEGMKAALELVKQVQGNGNKTMVLVLGDSDLNGNAKNGSQLTDRATIASEEDRAVGYADQIKALGGVIYCLDMGPVDKMSPLLQRIAGNAQDTKSDKGKYYWSGVTPNDLKARFSDVFADMIGSKQDVAVANVGASEITFGIHVPNNSVSEVNIVLELNKTKGVNTVKVSDPDGKAVNPGSRLLRYNAGNGGKDGYDYISLKIIDPEDGKWMITAGRGDSVRDDERFTIDLLYNYEVELEAHITNLKQNYYQKDSIDFKAQFMDSYGNPSTDDALYRGASADDPAITAEVRIYKNNKLVLSRDMNADRAQCNFNYTLPITDLGVMNAGDNVFTYTVYAEGDNLVRESEMGQFVVVNTCPQVSGADEVQLDAMVVDKLDGQPNDVITYSLAGHFADVDGDTLYYEIANAQELNVQARIEDGSLIVSSDEGNIQDCIKVNAHDPIGQTSEKISFYVDVVSVKALVTDYVDIGVGLDGGAIANVDGSWTLSKGSNVGVQISYSVGAGLNDKSTFPLNYLDALVNEEMLRACSTVNISSNLPAGSGTSYNANDATIQAGGEVVEFVLNAQVNMGGVSKQAQSGTINVQNVQPNIVADIDDKMTALGAQKCTDADGDYYLFTVDKDSIQEMTFDLSDWFEDKDAQNQYDQLNYVQPVSEALPEKTDIFTPARTVYRLVGVIAKEGDVVEASQVKNVPEQMNVKFVRFGEMMVTASATDNSGETISLRLKFSVDSSFETILCIALYVVAIIIIIIILAVLYNKLVIHQDWKTVKKPGYSVMLDGFTQITISGADTSDFRVKGRNKCKLSTLAREFEIGDDGAGNATFAKIELWPTTGKNIVVELAPKAKIPANILIKVDGKELKKKAIWKRNGRIEITYPNNMTGFECVCTFVRH